MTRPAVLARCLIACAFALTLVACGDDDGGGDTDSGVTDTGTPPAPPPTPPGTPPTPPTPPGTPPTPPTPPGTPPTPPTPVPPPPAGMCTNAADMTQLGMMFGPMMDKDASEVAGDCALECFVTGTEECFVDCMVRETMISTGCASCFGMSVACARDNCIGACLSDPSSPGCVACQCGDNPAMMNCRDVFTACSGIPSDDCG